MTIFNISTLILSIIGSITGILSLIIQYLTHVKSSANLKFIIEDNSYFFNTDDFNVKEYKNMYAIVISTRILNTSSEPITIYKVKIHNPYILPLEHENDFNFTPKKININSIYQSAKIVPFDNATLPLRIDAFDSKLVSFRFLIDKSKFKKQYNYSLGVNLSLYTPRKNYFETVILEKYDNRLMRLSQL